MIFHFSFTVVGKQSSDAIRIEPEFSNSSGQSFWKLKSYNSECDLLMQGNSHKKTSLIFLNNGIKI